MIFRRCAVLFLSLAALTLPACARVTRIEILTRQPVLNGQAFGKAGAYEEITARVYFAVNPSDPHNTGIVDLDKAPRNEAGEVEFSADLYLLRPVNAGNGACSSKSPTAAAEAFCASSTAPVPPPTATAGS